MLGAACLELDGVHAEALGGLWSNTPHTDWCTPFTGYPERYVDTSAFDAFLKKPFEFDEPVSHGARTDRP